MLKIFRTSTLDTSMNMERLKETQTAQYVPLDIKRLKDRQAAQYVPLDTKRLKERQAAPNL